MASENGVSTGSTPTPQVVGNAFVHQYYHILHQSPDLVYRFYQEDSKLSRPGPDGVMSSVTTMRAINEKILAMDYQNEVRAEISTVESQESLGSGVIVLVTGCLTGSDNVKKHFTQSFFLAPQDKGYYVLNDIFRYLKEDEESRGLTSSSVVALAPEQEAPVVQEQQIIDGMVLQPEEDVNDEEVYNPLENGEIPIVEEEVRVEEVINAAPSNPQEVAANSCYAVQEEAPKKSYASIVKIMKEGTSSIVASALALIKPAPVKTEREDPTPTPAFTKGSPDASLNATELDSVQEVEADGHSIYIKNLPLNATPAQLEEEFKRFGPIKPLGIQVRSHKQQGFCFGFVEFEVASAVQSAIEASPVMIGGRQAYVEEKRRAGSRVSSRGRFPPGRGGGFRNDGVRGRSGYGGGRGYARGDYNNRSDFGLRVGGRGRSSNHSGGDNCYQRVDHSGSNGFHGGHAGSLASNASSANIVPRVPTPA